MSVFYRIFSFIIIALCAGCNNSNTNKAIILQERQNNSQPLILAKSKMLVKDNVPSLLAFSPDSQSIMASYSDIGNHIYSLNRDEPPLIFNAENYPELAEITFNNAGFIDNNHIYFAGYHGLHKINSVQNSDKFKAYIYQLSLPELVVSQGYKEIPSYPIKVNNNYIAVDEQLTNWHSQQNWSVKIVSGTLPSYQLTLSGQVITFSWHNNWILLSDPINNNHYSWNSGIRIYLMALSTSEDYLITLSSKGDCVVWLLSDRSKIGHCGDGNWFNETGKKVILTNPLNDQFALIRDKKITVYSLPSLENIFELTFESEISDANISGDLLVVADNIGYTELWQVSSKKLLGTSPDSYLPTIQPNGEHLALIYDNQLQLYKIPK